jgi:hypothetical protein
MQMEKTAISAKTNKKQKKAAARTKRSISGPSRFSVCTRSFLPRPVLPAVAELGSRTSAKLGSRAARRRGDAASGLHEMRLPRGLQIVFNPHFFPQSGQSSAQRNRPVVRIKCKTQNAASLFARKMPKESRWRKKGGFRAIKKYAVQLAPGPRHGHLLHAASELN